MDFEGLPRSSQYCRAILAAFSVASGPSGHEPHAVEVRGRELGDRLGQGLQRLAGEQVHGHERDLARLGRHGVRDLLDAVADGGHGRRAARPVDVPATLGVPEVDALAPHDRGVGASEVAVEHTRLDQGPIHGRLPEVKASLRRVAAARVSRSGGADERWQPSSHSPSGASLSRMISSFPFGGVAPAPAGRSRAG